MASVNGDEASAVRKRLTFLDLPQETQKEIFGHCSQGDLICLSLVSKHFQGLAASQLYRNFHIVFPDEDDPAFDSPIDGLAGGLDTFVSSDYNYCKHLKDLSLDTLSSGAKAELAYKPYLYNVSCGKFMNTLLLLTLRKATTLETFTWNIRVELSRQVYSALHRIKTLSNVHIRLQAGPSLYETPPPLPFTAPSSTTLGTSSSHIPDLPIMPVLPAGFTMPPPPSMFYVAPTTTMPAPSLPKPPMRVKLPKKTSMSKEPPTLSAFKNLKSLSVLDIDSLDIITEIKSCVRNSSGTLSKLKLSLSDSLAMQARKPPPDLDPEDSDPDDEFQVVPVPANPGALFGDDVSGPAKVFRAQEERKSQEAILGRIFDVEPYLVKKPKRRAVEKEPKDKETKDDGGQSSIANPVQDFVRGIRALSTQLMKNTSGAGELNPQQLAALGGIEDAARKYVASEEAKGKDGAAPAETTSEAKAGGSSNSKYPTEGAPPEQKPSFEDLFAPKPTQVKEAEKDVSPDDINIEEPEEQLVIDPAESLCSKEDQPSEPTPPESEPGEPEPVENASSSKTTLPQANGSTVSPSFGKAMKTLSAQKDNFKTLADKLEAFEGQSNQLNGELLALRKDDGGLDPARITVAEKRMQNLSHNIQDIKREMLMIEREIDDAEKQIPASLPNLSSKDDADTNRRRVSEYVRSTRGLSLKSLSIYLIPVKASVLTKAIDLRVLKSLTLLNVGPQAPIWALLIKENKIAPVALRKIFTDNVTMTFLNFVNQLDELHELLMLERDSKYKPESFATKSTSTIEQIRRLVIRKHIYSLKRLMIKNLASQDWDVDDKTILLIATRGRLLEELAVSMNIRAVHILLQRISGLVNLRALHIVQLRNDDTCVWVMRETKRFLCDNLFHYPALKLEWVSIDDDACAQIVRPSQGPKQAKSPKSKGKEKATNLPNGSMGDPWPPFGPFQPNLSELCGPSEESDEEADEEDGISLTSGVHFSDVWGVRIFKKEVISGRL